MTGGEWRVEEGFCRVEQILVLAPHQKAKTSLAECSRVATWPLIDHLERAPGQLNLLAVRRAKGLDSLGVILIDFPQFDRLAEGQDKMDFFMGASRARQLLAVLHLEDIGNRDRQRRDRGVKHTPKSEVTLHLFATAMKFR